MVLEHLDLVRQLVALGSQSLELRRRGFLIICHVCPPAADPPAGKDAHALSYW
jgi:hypothetical protein